MTPELFDNREKGFEARYAHDKELQFKAEMRAIKELGLWAAMQLGRRRVAAEKYSNDLVDMFLREGAPHAIARVKTDVAAFNLTAEKIVEAQFRLNMEECRRELFEEA